MLLYHSGQGGLADSGLTGQMQAEISRGYHGTRDGCIEWKGDSVGRNVKYLEARLESTDQRFSCGRLREGEARKRRRQADLHLRDRPSRPNGSTSVEICPGVLDLPPA